MSGAGADQGVAGQSPRPPAQLLAIAVAAMVVLGVVIAFALNRSTPWKRAGPPITVSAWAPYWQSDSALASFNANLGVFNEVSMFAYSTTAANSVTPYAGLDPNVPLLFQRSAAPSGIQVTASIIDATKPHEMAAILADPASRSVHVQTIVQFVIAGGFAGVDLDYENFAFNDGRDSWATTRPNWVAFIKELGAAMHAGGKSLTVSVPPVYDSGRTDLSGYWVYDYAAIGAVVDHIRIMAYDYSTSAPGPIAPLAWVQNLVQAARSMVAPGKLVLGVPVYGYDWVVSTTGVCPVDRAPRRNNVSTKSAAALAASHGVTPLWDASRSESTFSYVDKIDGVDAAGAPVSCTVNRTVWFADAQAVHARAWLAERQDLGGISLWSLGSDDATSWVAVAAARADHSTWPP
ncbi:unannotated protein [freshwater metagenome]|uniref:Unannotated protein n=1 Tax=freshwater metagenome TaxID=449393 RepID=A0A6J7FCS0_9ZZZZ